MIGMGNGVLSYRFAFDAAGDVHRHADGQSASWHVRFDANPISLATGRPFEPEIADLLDIALAAYVADRLSPRRSLQDDFHGLQWRREIHVSLPIRSAHWREKRVLDLLVGCLNHLTNDAWTFDFQSTGASRFDGERQLTLPGAEIDYGSVALFSGGLDSFVGGARLLKENTAGPIALVSGVSGSRHGSQQSRLADVLRRSSKKPIAHVRVGYSIEDVDAATEVSQRARPFLFFALGAAVARGGRCEKLFVHENGIGSINLPLDSTQLGTRSARAVHPRFLYNFGSLLRELMQSPFEVLNPFQFATKASACREWLQEPAWRACIADTFSCDGFPVRVKGRPQCGFCTSCVLRRLALEAGGLSAWDASERYLRNITSNIRSLPRHVQDGVAVSEWQCARLREALARKDRWQALVEVYPELIEAAAFSALNSGMTRAECEWQLIELYEKHLAEWDSFSARRSYVLANVA
jgi:7-cyano-7-deazaguanine synthase in queuosine biosynthesis